MSTKLVKAVQKYLRHINQNLLNKFITLFEEDNGVRRPWNSDLQKDADSARIECAGALMQVALVPQGLHVPGVSEPVFKKSKVRYSTAGLVTD